MHRQRIINGFILSIYFQKFKMNFQLICLIFGIGQEISYIPIKPIIIVRYVKDSIKIFNSHATDA